MKTSQITIRVDENLKENAEQTFENIGLSMTTAMVLFMKSVIREGKIPFELKTDLFYRRENLDELKRRADEMKDKNNVVVKTMAELRGMESE